MEELSSSSVSFSDNTESMMARGEYLRHLRQLAEADEMERDRDENDNNLDDNEEGLKRQRRQEENKSLMKRKNNGGECGHSLAAVATMRDDHIVVLPDSGKTVLQYESYLSHQRYYDDLKHVDVSFIDYGIVAGKQKEEKGGGRLIIEQRKELGKGGLCWDAAFILAEHLIATEAEWKPCSLTDLDFSTKKKCRIVELGSGTGLCGLMIAKAISVSLYITDLPELLDLMVRNLTLNFNKDCIFSVNETRNEGEKSTTAGSETDMDLTDRDLNTLYSNDKNNDDPKKSAGYSSATILRWGEKDDYKDICPFDVVIGADVVASIYDPSALAQTIHGLCDDHTKVFVSYKGRLTRPHEEFERAMRELFSKVERVKPISRNKNPDVWILQAEGKVKVKDQQ